MNGPTPVDHARIEALIPHAGRMCLLYQALDWDEAGIRCSALSHLAEDNPLRNGGMLGILAGIEYGAQAMAVHGALLAESQGERLPPGYLAAVRDVVMHAERLDDVPGMLQVEARRLMGQGGLLMYAVRIGTEAGTPLLEGRLTVAERGGAQT
ncbi:MAG: hydroxymyristoyl-ACP dehydratase [Gammaproteobacteria bacterium]|nr:MAG: hydroxymyristoyl-ACP dehydratase [Gammaproteobacteria bacterium]